MSIIFVTKFITFIENSMAKRSIDIVAALFGLIIMAPVMVVILAVVFWHDKHSPFYKALRIGLNGKPFIMWKVRTMIVNAETVGASSTKADDFRITQVGAFIRKYKLDEIPQLWNVLLGTMSLVGPRPNVASEVHSYNEKEFKILTLQPGITDLASIVFADEGEILKGSDDPDLAYNKLIWPWKCRLALFYVENRNIWMDGVIIFLTFLSIISRKKALHLLGNMLERSGVSADLVLVSRRIHPLEQFV